LVDLWNHIFWRDVDHGLDCRDGSYCSGGPEKALEKEITANGVVGFIDELGQGLGNQHSRIHIYQDDNSNHQYLTLEKVTISNRDQGSEVRYPVIENLKITMRLYP